MSAGQIPDTPPEPTGGVFAESYAVVGAVSKVIPVDLHIRGCPPRPIQLIEGLLRLIEPNPRAARRVSDTSAAANEPD